MSASTTISIDDLPPEMINELFEYLHLKDLAACSMVNRRWHSIYAAFKLHTLVAINFGAEFNYGPIKFYDSNRRVEEADRCRPSMFVRLAEKPLLSNLKQLVLCGFISKFDLNELNQFRHLVHLDFRVNSDQRKAVHLNLPRLRVLALSAWNHRCALSVDCPELSTLYYSGKKASLLQVKHPEVIRKLETCIFDPKWLAPFKSVECLVTWELQAISKATLLSLPKLRELHYNGDIYYMFMEKFPGVGKDDRVKRMLSEFLGEAKKLKGSDFRFTFAGLQLTNVNVNQIDFGVQVYEDEEEPYERVWSGYIYLKNYHLIEPGALYYVRNAYYISLLEVTGVIPSCFSQKFTGIEFVEVNDLVKDPDHLLSFLKSLRFLRILVLDLQTTELGQEFYDQLPAAARSLVSLNLEAREPENEPENELQLNFDFIDKLSSLFNLNIKQSLSFESAISLVRWLSRLEEGRFNVQSREVSGLILKQRGYKWNFYKWCGKRTEFGNPEEIVNFFNGLQHTREVQPLTSQTS